MIGTTKIRIINAAFLLIGQNEVVEINNDSPLAVKQASTIYDMFYANCLDDYEWSFALKQYRLNKILNPEEVMFFDSAYQLPSDFIRVYCLSYNNFKIFGDKLYTDNVDDLKMIYMAKVDESKLSQNFINYLILKMASLFSVPITQKTDMVQYYDLKAKDALFSAIQKDSSQSPSDMIQSQIWMYKYGGFSGAIL